MGTDIILGVTESTAAAPARAWALDRAAARGARVREVLIVPTRDDVAEAAAATTDADMLVLPADHGHPYRALIAAVHCPVAIVPADAAGGRSGVLVGVDASDVSERALAFAAAEAAARGETLIALAAWEPVGLGAEPGIDLWTGAIAADLSEATTGMLERMLAPVRAAHPGLEIVPRVDVGDASTLIAAASADVALTVVGSHGRTGLSRLLLGSVSEHVAEQLSEHVATVTVVVR